MIGLNKAELTATNKDFMELISQKEIEEINQIEGEITGLSLKEDLQFIKSQKGEEGLEKVKMALEALDFPLKIEEIKSSQWYPWKKNLLLLLVAKRIFNWDEEKMREWGRFTAKTSFINKLIMKFFVSLDNLIEEAQNAWNRYFSCGEIEIEKISKREQIILLTIKDFPSHPIFCRELEGYLWQILSYVLPKENLKVQELECSPKKNRHHFKISW